MSELDKVLDKVMEIKAELIQESAPDADKEELIAALRDKKKQSIILEIREEYKKELIREAKKEVNEEANRQKIEDLRNLMWSGFFLAFLVGLAVNQVTDIIGYYKGTVAVDEIWPTVAWSVALCGVCIVAYIYNFLVKAISLINNSKNKKKGTK
ncbi:hypothetical protein FMM80_21480 [Schaedlerella arabinosiphila]|jgi:hypothetical protein|uniref:Uncharacterized protein n=1 Tax=Schaedlerella arabinosiphila TaxID=2044587 RepID=A0A9X5CDX6_9FIRM|nr:hypothetical protein [Schaedlerella arabinosiphila]KAI4442009.1 hypothetical protein C824_004519 [Schaedlerella arabinosiphila]MCI9633804.1 hypothetical protein [Ruminococcus sp.]NDO71082.1 hypothetical protein [Schaedlerella arabinosiphila]